MDLISVNITWGQFRGYRKSLKDCDRVEIKTPEKAIGYCSPVIEGVKSINPNALSRPPVSLVAFTWDVPI